MQVDKVTLQEPILRIENLNLFLGRRSLRRQILFDINLELQPGEIVIMTGPSGAGKTSLLTLIGGLRTVREGSLQLMGQELAGASSQKLVKIRRQIGYIFQGHNLLPFLTARQNVQMPFELYRIPSRLARKEAEAMLQAVKLGDRMNYYPQQLSIGQKQRVAIARALVTQPRLILADEPTASLDSKTGRDVIELMQRLAKDQGSAVLMVTHDNRILDIADRIISMEDGRLLTQ
ncbi:MAG: DevA family ABC transporter ATP-binding protein [Leptolyngbya sp. IPPAS B-1204]|uniref:DevA family ABC transporter ATP-binding protein n=1 Tax=Leptolyngbya sp. NK1-12 TaxID=2547451 RepID=A0AA97AEY8_9CYAN|nr:DevA family ABC transporter ATP-binding protein [Leptolyngbya sp. NK1-12]RNJ65233.1 MAG: ATP-binding cassette domain-containing protein [Leptolyngbya sp. IPPAS B-1204]WNZ21719.1 DevA family ABC transporter ATP-binding protein [Leptolyngbya sp. NK1-12]